MATLLPSRLTTRPTPRAEWRSRLPRVELPHVEVSALKALPLRSRRKQRPIDRLSALVTRQVTRPATRWWHGRSRAQRISTIALGVSGTAALLSASVWGGSRLLARRQARLAALATPAALPEGDVAAEASELLAEETAAVEAAPISTPAR